MKEGFCSLSKPGARTGLSCDHLSSVDYWKVINSAFYASVFLCICKNDYVKHLGSANEKHNARSTYCWVDCLVPAFPAFVTHKLGSCSWEEFTAAL